ncbi:DUF2190 family protein [Pseudoduganella sp. FT55W]|uniref:DUF2190 family protein n=1 Tax=Duganella rivi TaxID=2666083 RepID=A0A7X4K8W6_9BURK|nr:capsid cement protein [Duganella rivi]MYM65436.1 DUF2190 family protein [Duganella rivi]
MAKNYVQDGEVLSFTAITAVSSGAVVVIGKRIGIALGDIAVGQSGPVQVTDVWQLPKLTTDVVAQGDLLYWDAGNNRLTTTVGSNILAGYAAYAAGNGAGTVNIKINA